MISFAYCNAKLHNPTITKEDVERVREQFETGAEAIEVTTL
jgi:hypothetical protein